MFKRTLIYSAALLAAFSAAHAADPSTEVTPAAVTVQKIEGGHTFADAKGMTLYTFDPDKKTPGTSSCTKERHCEIRWPPLFATEADKPVGEWTIITRPEGKLQWAYKGLPVYTYLDDLSPRVLSGDNAGGRWHALAMWAPAPAPIMPAGIQVKRKGDVWFFTDFEGREIHAPAKSSKCDTACQQKWRPLRASGMAQPTDKWTVIDRGDGYRQWAYDGVGLYVANDGQALMASNDWKLVEVR